MCEICDDMSIGKKGYSQNFHVDETQDASSDVKSATNNKKLMVEDDGEA